MKARVKKTGEIVNLESYATINSWGNPIEMKPEEVELIQEPTEDEHWQDVRERAAIAIMQGLLSDQSRTGSAEEYAKAAIEYTDVLIGELKKK